MRLNGQVPKQRSLSISLPPEEKKRNGNGGNERIIFAWIGTCMPLHFSLCCRSNRFFFPVDKLRQTKGNVMGITSLSSLGTKEKTRKPMPRDVIDVPDIQVNHRSSVTCLTKKREGNRMHVTLFLIWWLTCLSGACFDVHEFEGVQETKDRTGLTNAF